MIHFLLLQNRQGRTRLSKYYTTTYTDQEKHSMQNDIFKLVVSRNSKHCNFIEYKSNYKIIYRRYAGLYFIYVVDSNDNELSYLESMYR